MTKKELLILIILLALGATLRLYRVDYFSLWDDEARTYITCAAENPRQVLRTILTLLTHNPPLDPLIRHAVMSLTEKNTFYFTLPSVFLSLAGIVLYFLLARQLLGSQAALIFAALMALHPMDISYAQTGRNYAILNVVVPLSFLLLRKALHSNRFGAWILYGLSLALCMYAHFLAVGIALAQAVLFLQHQWECARSGSSGRELRRAVWGYGAGGVLAVALLLPWVQVLPSSNQALDFSQIRIDNLRMVAVVANNFAGGTYAAPLMLLLTLAGLLHCRKNARKAGLLIIVVLVTGYVTSLLLTMRSFFHPRYVYCLLPFFLMLPACGTWMLGTALTDRGTKPVRGLTPGRLAAAALVLLCCLQIPRLQEWYQTGWAVDGNWRAAVAHVEQQRSRSDIIVVPYVCQSLFSTYSSLPVYGLQPYPLHWQYISPVKQVRRLYYLPPDIPAVEASEFNARTGRTWYNINFNLRDDMANTAILDFLTGNNTPVIWLIWRNAELGAAKATRFFDLLQQRYRREHSKQFDKATVIKYALKQ
ncbi:glycosyltransferase family 39 protein [Thermodesulfobacteriota bacterium]